MHPGAVKTKLQLMGKWDTFGDAVYRFTEQHDETNTQTIRHLNANEPVMTNLILRHRQLFDAR